MTNLILDNTTFSYLIQSAGVGPKALTLINPTDAELALNAISASGYKILITDVVFKEISSDAPDGFRNAFNKWYLSNESDITVVTTPTGTGPNRLRKNPLPGSAAI